jgi:hypothetical protein
MVTIIQVQYNTDMVFNPVFLERMKYQLGQRPGLLKRNILFSGWKK